MELTLWGRAATVLLFARLLLHLGLCLTLLKCNARRVCHVVVGTPGRVLALLQRGALPVSRLKLLVLDEADKLLGTDSFGTDVEAILGSLPERKQVRPGGACAVCSCIAVGSGECQRKCWEAACGQRARQRNAPGACCARCAGAGAVGDVQPRGASAAAGADAAAKGGAAVWVRLQQGAGWRWEPEWGM